MMPVVPQRSARMHFAMEGATGFDALLLFAMTLGLPLFESLARRIFALKILRHYKLGPESIWRALFSRGRVLTAPVTFECAGRLCQILDTRGSTVML